MFSWVNVEDVIIYQYNDKLLVGELFERTAYHMQVRLISPFINWTIETTPLDISKYGLNQKRNYLTDLGIEISENLLVEAYKKLVMIDENIDALAKMYDGYRESIYGVDLDLNGKYRKQIMDKTKEWFFNTKLIPPEITGFHLTPVEISGLEFILTHYLNSGKKIYKLFKRKRRNYEIL